MLLFDSVYLIGFFYGLDILDWLHSIFFDIFGFWIKLDKFLDISLIPSIYITAATTYKYQAAITVVGQQYSQDKSMP